jgi:hypothetical protein
MIPVRMLPAAVAALLVLPVAQAAPGPFAPATPVAGLGNRSALAQMNGAALFPSGASALVGTSDNAGNRRAFAAFGAGGAPPVAARGFGPAGGAFDFAFAANAGGDSAVTYTVGHVAYLTTCHGSACRPTARVGSSALKPQSAVAVQPVTGRTIVMWRGRTSRGANRLQWRMTTAGRLGATHTLGEFGDTPQLGTDASGRTVAAWLRGRTGVRTAARRVGGFASARTVTTAPAADLRLTTSAAGESVLAWLAGAGAADPEAPAGSVLVSVRTGASSFGPAQGLGIGSTLALAGSPDGHFVVTADRHVGPTSVVVAAARRDPGHPFTALADVSSPQFVSDAFGASVAVADGGRALVTWAAAADPSAPVAPAAGIFAAVAEPAAAFAPPQLLADARTATLPQRTAAAVAADAALVAWVGPQGGWVARAAG